MWFTWEESAWRPGRAALVQRGQDARSRRARGDAGKDQPAPGRSRSLGHRPGLGSAASRELRLHPAPGKKPGGVSREEAETKLQCPNPADLLQGGDRRCPPRSEGLAGSAARPCPSPAWGREGGARQRGWLQLLRQRSELRAGRSQHVPSWGRGARLRQAPSPCSGHGADEQARQQQEAALVSHRRHWSCSPDSVCGIHNEMDTAYCSNLL